MVYKVNPLTTQMYGVHCRGDLKQACISQYGSFVMNHCWSCCKYTVRLGCRTSCLTPNRKMVCQFQIVAYASRPALGWTLASFVNTGIRVHHLEQQAACECFFCAGTRPGYWHISCHINVQCIGRQGLVQTWVCIFSCQKHSYCNSL